MNNKPVKLNFNLHTGPVCNQPEENERVRVFGKHAAIVYVSSRHEPGTVKTLRVDRHADGGNRAAFFYVPSVALAFVMQLRHVVERLLDGSALDVWPPVPGSDEQDLRLRSEFAREIAQSVRIMRRHLIKNVAHRHHVRQRDVRERMQLPWQTCQDLLQEADRQIQVLEETCRTVSLLLQVRNDEPCVQRLPLPPHRDHHVQRINDMMALLERVDDRVSGQLARESRDALRTARQALYGVDVEPYRESLVEALDQALVALVVIKVDLTTAYAWMAATIGHAAPVAERAALVNSIADVAGQLSTETWRRFIAEPQSPRWTARLIDLCLRATGDGDAAQLTRLEKKLRQLRVAFSACKRERRPTLVRLEG